MRIYSKKAYRFRNKGIKVSDPSELLNPKTSADLFFICKPADFQDAPEWIRTDPMFESAIKSGNMYIVQSQPALPVEAIVTKAKKTGKITESATTAEALGLSK